MNKRDDPQRVGDLLDPVGRRIGVNDARSLGRLTAHWREMVGETVASHACPTSLRDGVLRVRVASPVWATEIGYLATRIRSQVNAALGARLVQQVRVYSAPDSSREETSTPAVNKTQAPVATFRWQEQTDPREAFEHARAAWEKSTSERK
jgi:predicted nucleic acid-binding Zn ribbon protein